MSITNLIKDVTSLYLYGSRTVPAVKSSEALIRNANMHSPESLNVDSADFMKNGGGRFVNGAKFEIIDLFFDAAHYTIPAGRYTKSAIMGHLGYTGDDKIFWSMSQLDYQDSKDDYAERVYVFNSTNFKVSDDAIFVVESNGARSIENYAIEPFSTSTIPDNFDFVGGSPLANIGNGILQPAIDPWNIGRTVDIVYSDNVPKKTYTLSAYQADVTNEVIGNKTDYLKALNGMNEIIQGLWDSGVTKFLDDKGRPIIYGTIADGDTLTGATANTLELYKPYYKNGVAIYGDFKNDHITGSEYNDYLNGGYGADKIYGKGGNDEIIGQAVSLGMEEDLIDGGAGIDTVNYAKLENIGVRVTMTGTNGSVQGWNGTATIGTAKDTLVSIETIIGTAQADRFITNGGAVTLQGGAGGDTYIIGTGVGLGRTKIVEKPGDSGRDAIGVPSGVTPTTYEKEPSANGTRLKPQEGQSGPSIDVPNGIEDVETPEGLKSGSAACEMHVV